MKNCVMCEILPADHDGDCIGALRQALTESRNREVFRRGAEQTRYDALYSEHEQLANELTRVRRQLRLLEREYEDGRKQFPVRLTEERWGAMWQVCNLVLHNPDFNDSALRNDYARIIDAESKEVLAQRTPETRTHPLLAELDQLQAAWAGTNPNYAITIRRMFEEFRANLVLRLQGLAELTKLAEPVWPNNNEHCD